MKVKVVTGYRNVINDEDSHSTFEQNLNRCIEELEEMFNRVIDIKCERSDIHGYYIALVLYEEERCDA